MKTVLTLAAAFALALAAQPAHAGWSNGLHTGNGLNSGNGLGTSNGISTTNGLGTQNGLGTTNGISTTNGIAVAPAGGMRAIHIRLPAAR